MMSRIRSVVVLCLLWPLVGPLGTAIPALRGARFGAPAMATLGAQASATAILDRVTVTGRRAIDFHAAALPDTVYVGQQATYQVAVMLSQDAKSRLRRNPEFLPPELRGLLAYELGTPVRVGWRRFGDNEFESHIFQRALFPVAAGAHVVPAPQLSYALPQSSSYFSREERFVVKAESASFVVKPLPAENRPADFNGAVGVLKASVRMDSTTARVGDPLVLTMRVQGTGNVKLLPRPVVELDWASVVTGTERVLVDSSGPLVKGTKEFDWILTPTRSGAVELPALRYSYFDPYAAEYAVATSDPAALTVREGSLAVLDAEDGSALLPLRALPAAPANRYWWFGSDRISVLGWLALVLCLLAPLPWFVMRRRQQQSARLSRLGAAKVAPATVAQQEDRSPRGVARAGRRRLLDALAVRFEQTPQELLSRLHVAKVLRRGGVTRATTRSVLEMLQQLDELGFSEIPASDTASDVISDTALSATNGQATAPHSAVTPGAIDNLLRAIDAEAMPKGRHIRRKRVGTGAAVALVCAAIAQMSPLPVTAQQAPDAPVAVTQTPAQTGAGGVAGNVLQLATDAYERRAFTEAAMRFSALADTYPFDPDILVNWGTAAWTLGDTVSAVVAWQRAGRLQPFAADIQERIRLLPAGARGGIADIPMVPVTLLSILAVVLWIAGWLAFTLWAGRQNTARESAKSTGVMHTVIRDSRTRTVALCTMAMAIVLAIGAWWGRGALDASSLSVVMRPETMRIAPGLDANAMGGVSTGDVVRVLEIRETWQQVVHADGRRGWLPSGRLVAMSATPSVR